MPEVHAVRPHLEPLAEPGAGRQPGAVEVARDAEAVLRIVREQTGSVPRELRFLETDNTGPRSFSCRAVHSPV